MKKHYLKEFTVREIIENAREDICSNYCKYPCIYHERFLQGEYKTQDEADTLMNDEVCVDCPLTTL